jgi:hypothetical protein
LNSLKKPYRIQFKALFLLLVYLFSNGPSILFHNHLTDIAAYEKATACEKVIYYADNDANCKHQNHVANAVEKCWLCDNHTLSPHLFQTFLPEYFSKKISASYTELCNYYYFQTPSRFLNRGPPSVSSFTV